MIRDLLNLADEAEKHGDLKQADANLERAQVLARELEGRQVNWNAPAKNQQPRRALRWGGGAGATLQL